MNAEKANFVLARIIASQAGKSKDGVIFLKDTKPYSCGKDKDNDIRCNGANVAGKHCIFFHYPNEVFIKDLSDSEKGVYVNGKHLKPHRLIKLQENDLIGIGTCRKTSNDSGKFIYRLQKQAAVDVIDDSLFPEVRKRSLESNGDHQPSKILKNSDYIEISPTNVSVAEGFGSTSFTYNIGNCFPQSSFSGRTTGVQSIPSVPAKSVLSEENLSTNYDNHEKSLMPPQSPPICEFSGSDTDTNSTIILNNSGILSEDEEDTYEIEELNRNKIAVKKETDLIHNVVILLDNDSDATKLSEEGNRLDEINYEDDTTFGSDTEEIPYRNVKPLPVVLDLDDATDIEEELPMDKSEKIDEPVVININVDTREVANNRADNPEGKLETRIPELIELDSEDSSLENGFSNSLIKSKIKGEEGFDSEGSTDIEEELPLVESETAFVIDFLDSNENFTTSKGDLIKSSKVPFVVPREFVKNNTKIDLNLCRSQSDAKNFISKSISSIDQSSVEDSRALVKEKVTVQEAKLVVDRFNTEPSKSIIKCGYNNIIESKETATPIPDEKVSTSETECDKLISQILEWNAVDFQIRTTGKKCPILKSYKSYEQYYEVLKSHLIFEIAYKVKKNLVSGDKHSILKCDVVKNSASKIIIDGTNSCMLAFYVYIRVDHPATRKVPAIGDLVRLEISCDYHKYAILGYVKNVTTINPDSNCIQVICAIMTKFLDLNIYMSTVSGLHVVTGLLAPLNMMQALTDIKSSRLLPLILNPGKENYPARDPLEEIKLSPSACLKLYHVSTDQAYAVMEISKVIERQEPKICILEGPPGTGKTTVLIDAISNVLLNKEENSLKPKILVCAKSRMEVDEIVFRLAFAKKKLQQGKDIKLVRIGDPETASPEVKQFTSEVLAKRHVDLGIKEFLLAEEVALSRNVRKISEEEVSKLMVFAENMILSEANVIVCTLSMRLANKLDVVYGKTGKISVCIIDEATQISEIEILKPLTYGVNTLVLLGDPFRSLIVGKSYIKSKKPKKIDNALFSRIKANYEVLENTPTFSLDRQYRINPNVVFWLNKLVYKEYMKSGFPAMNYPLLSYKVLNLFPYCIRHDEPLFVSTLISCIVQFAKIDRIIKPMRIGVILPITTFKSEMISKINTSLSTILVEKRDMFKIDVDTLSAFKNQERDVIIISCSKITEDVEDPVGDEWLYSAMTRVKHSLILYGTFRKNMKPSLLSSVVRSAVPKNSYFNIIDPASPSELKNYVIRKRVS
ncbi:probable helicase senataxin isoform X2 [Belonocnema kinseyi]|uniref:probable helicase senataxin isoform X2 n=1 Tax=Belonocnema kinseyi TaxID=2817044 RepID=UPI00143D4C7A|nr:probable helicase senataxin isoform X2 [Belonocnema kinseyi]